MKHSTQTTLLMSTAGIALAAVTGIALVNSASPVKAVTPLNLKPASHVSIAKPKPKPTKRAPLTVGQFGPDGDSNGKWQPLPHCEQEDGGSSEPCVWDAAVDGNGTGMSYIIYPRPDGEPRFVYLTKPTS